MRDDMIDEATVIAWIDGELDAARAAAVSAAVATDPALARMADAHRAVKTRFSAAFGSIGDPPVAVQRNEPAAVISIAAARAAREARQKAEQKAVVAKPRRWMIPGVIAASLIAGVLLFQPVAGPGGSAAGIGDKANALALAPPIAKALDGQLSGKVGTVRVALSFRSRDGRYCRSFAATHLAGVACRDDDGWQLRYAGSADKAGGDYRQAGDDAAQSEVIDAMIMGEPLDAVGEAKARDSGWK